MTPNQVNSITILQTNQLGSKISKGINSEFVCAFLGLQLEVKPSQAVVEHTCLIPALGGGADLSSKPAYSTTYSTNDCKGYTEKPCWGWRDGGWGVGLENTLIPVLYHQHHKYLQEDNIHCYQAGKKTK